MPACCSWSNLSNIPWYDSDGMRYDDPIQGNQVINCALFAALSSIAWVQPDPFRGFLNPPKIGSYRYFKIYNPTNVSDYRIYYVNLDVCMSSNLFVFGRSKNPYGEIWPAIWEKAYAAYRSDLPTGTKVEKNIDMCSLNWGGNAFNALITLTGSTNHWPQPKTIKPVGSPEISTDEILADINDVSISCNTNSYKVVGPSKMVAWTYYQSSSVPIPGYNYNVRVAANHNYSILGYYIDGTGDLYIVLRNPWGSCPPTLDPDNPTQNMVWCGYTLNGLNGTLAITIEEFQTAFEAYGLVN